VHPWTSC